MTNLTLRVDDDALERARIRALKEGTSVNALVRRYIESYAGRDTQEHARRRLVELSTRLGADRRGTWERDDLYTDRIAWPR